jgi:hypothetical protein
VRAALAIDLCIIFSSEWCSSCSDVTGVVGMIGYPSIVEYPSSKTIETNGRIVSESDVTEHDPSIIAGHEAINI